MVGQKKVTLLPLTTKESSRHSASRMHPSFIVLEPSARRRVGYFYASNPANAVSVSINSLISPFFVHLI